MKLCRSVNLVACLLAAAAFAAPSTFAAEDGGFLRVAPEGVQWKDLPGYEGVQYAVLDGDPAKAGVYVVRVKFSPGVMSRPHFHPEDRYAVVLKGTWYTGTGDTFDPDKTVGSSPAAS